MRLCSLGTSTRRNSMYRSNDQQPFRAGESDTELSLHAHRPRPRCSRCVLQAATRCRIPSYSRVKSSRENASMSSVRARVTTEKHISALLRSAVDRCSTRVRLPRTTSVMSSKRSPFLSLRLTCCDHGRKPALVTVGSIHERSWSKSSQTRYLTCGLPKRPCCCWKREL
jgi:hypothetical protein